jgi:hypothetical protein
VTLLSKEVVFKTNMGQANNWEGEEEALALDIECLNGDLARITKNL